MTRIQKLVSRAIVASVFLLVAACSQEHTVSDPRTGPSLDTDLRQEIGNWGAVPIGAVPQQNPQLVELGRALFFDKVLSGNRDVACATCHDPDTHLADGLALSVGTGGVSSGGTRTPGAGRQHVPRNSPSLLNEGIGLFYMFWDGRASEEGSQFSRFKAPPGVVLPGGLSGVLAAQAMLPVLNRAEMRGEPGDRDRFGNVNELASLSDAKSDQIWVAAMNRLLAIDEYVSKFNAAYPQVAPSSLGYQHVANALAAFQVAAFTKTNSPFDRFLARQPHGMSDEAKRGGILFFGKARCSQCHNGPLLGGSSFMNDGVPQFGPGVGSSAPLDMGRGEEFVNKGGNFQGYEFAFRVPPLRNVELTAPYMHNGAYPTLEAVIRHYDNVDSAMTNYDVTQIAPELRGTLRNDAATINRMRQSLAFQLRQPLHLSSGEQQDLVAFLKALTDPAARNLSGIRPSSVPSGLPVR